MIQIFPGRYFSQIWFLHAEGVPMDVLASMWKDGDGWAANVRLRMYDGDQTKTPFDDGDTKRCYNLATRSSSEEESLRELGACFRRMADDLGLTIETVPVRTDDPHKIIEILKRQPWAHIKELA